MAKIFDESYFESLNEDLKFRFIKLCSSGVQNPDSSIGCYAISSTD